MEWVTIAKFNQLHEAQAAQGALEAEGIETLVPDAQMARFYPSNLVGGARLQVPKDQEERAKKIMQQFQD